MNPKILAIMRDKKDMERRIIDWNEILKAHFDHFATHSVLPPELIEPFFKPLSHMEYKNHSRQNEKEINKHISGYSEYCPRIP